MAGRATPLAPDRRVAEAPAAGRDSAAAGTADCGTEAAGHIPEIPDRDTVAPDRDTGASGRDTGAASARRSWLTWRRLPVLLELATLGAAYGAPSLVRIVLTTTRAAAFGHAVALYRVETELGLNVEPWLNHLVAPHAVAALLAGYYYALLHFILTPLALAWLYVFRPRAFPRLRSALVLSTIGANIVFWTWPVAPPRFAIPGLTDILTSHNVLDAGDPHGVTGAANLYAALPSLHVCWAAWCALVVVTATRSRWRHLAWLYPAATTFVVLATANHFVFDVAGGLAITALGLAATRLRPVRLRSIHLPRLATVGTAVLNAASLSGAAFGALVGVPIPAAAVVSAARLTAAHPPAGHRPVALGEARGQGTGHGVHVAGQGPS